MHTDLTFFTNEPEASLLDRFKRILNNNTQYFDVLVGYFRMSGFHQICESLGGVEHIRILVGIEVDKKTADALDEAKSSQYEIDFSHYETSDLLYDKAKEEIDSSDDDINVETGLRTFIDFVRRSKLEIRAYPSKSIHAKVYIMRKYPDKSDSYGSVITGSSNFSLSGLRDNLEFNVELKDSRDVKYALDKFDELWKDSVEISDEFIERLVRTTWLNDTITPYELYLKMLYEYFKSDLEYEGSLVSFEHIFNYKQYEYQEQAVINAQKILDEYGGVFISDVVGLGKTYITAMLSKQLALRTLVIAPPALIRKENPGSWYNVMFFFSVPCHIESIGKIDKLSKTDLSKYDLIIIDEAHRFRTEDTASYEHLATICQGKKVILVTATPFNNSPSDVFSQLKLFQKPRNSDIPGIRDLESYFNKLTARIRKIDKNAHPDEYRNTLRSISGEIKEKVFKYVMVRRTRTEIEKYFAEDLKKQKLKFPTILDPFPCYYELDDNEDTIFMGTIRKLIDFNYARYTPLLYYTGDVSQAEELAAKNMRKFMKILMVKRLESSFYAFRLTLERFISIYESYIKELKDGRVFISKKYSKLIYELLENDDYGKIEKIIAKGEAVQVSSADFEPGYLVLLEQDLNTLYNIKQDWERITRDPKLEKLIELFKTDSKLQKNKVIMFSEAKDTVDYLYKEMKSKLDIDILAFSSQSNAAVHNKVIANFDANADSKSDEYKLLLSTEVLSEGVNLHRSNIVLNYDIPWNPTRMMQRVGRVNRVDTKFTEIYTYNFFPAIQSEDVIGLRKTAENKIAAFISMLGSDSRLLTENEEIEQHELFDRLLSAKTITGEDEDETELKYLQAIKHIRDNDLELYDKVKHLPVKARSAKNGEENQLITYFRKGKLEKFYSASEKTSPQEVDFMTAAAIMECDQTDNQASLRNDVFYPLLKKNKDEFMASDMDVEVTTEKGGRDKTTHIIKHIKALYNEKNQLTENQEEYIRLVVTRLEEGILPKKTLKELVKAIDELKKLNEFNLMKLYLVLEKGIPSAFIYQDNGKKHQSSKREIILSELINGD